MASPYSSSTRKIDGCGVGQLLCFRYMQAITADTVIAYVTHDDRHNIIVVVKPARSEARAATWRGL